jgi:hypothetical protein
MAAIPAFPEGDYSATLDLSPGAGFVADAVTCTIVTYVAQADIPFGVAVQNGSLAGSCVLGIVGTNGAHPTDFLGIATMEQTAREANARTYRTGEEVGVLIAGTIVVANSDTSTASIAGGRVGVTAATGAITADATGAPALTGAQWLDAADDSGGLGRIRLIATPQA